MTERDDDFGDAPTPPEPFDPSTQEFPAVGRGDEDEPQTEERPRDPGRPFMPPDLEEEMGGSLDLDADLEQARLLEAERIERRHEAVSMDTSTFMAIPAPTPTTPFVPPEFDEKAGAPGPLDGVLLDRDGLLARRRPGPGDRRGELLRHHGADVRVHHRLPGPEPGPLAVRGRRDPGRLRAGLHRGAREGQQARGVPARLDPDLHGHPGARGDHGALHPARAGHHAASSRPASAARSST